MGATALAPHDLRQSADDAQWPDVLQMHRQNLNVRAEWIIVASIH